jgi:hypothetical protein
MISLQFAPPVLSTPWKRLPNGIQLEIDEFKLFSAPALLCLGATIKVEIPSVGSRDK